MPATANQIIALANTVFAEGYLYGTPSGETAFSDDLIFGKLQEVKIDNKFTFKELMGPEALVAVALAAEKREITVNAKNAIIRGRNLLNLMGGALTYSSPSTTLAITGGNGANGPNDIGPGVIGLHIKTPLDGSDIEVKINAAVCQQLSIPLTLRSFVIQDWTAQVFMDSSNSIISIILPGNQTTS